jgi:WD40 repeat protein
MFLYDDVVTRKVWDLKTMNLVETLQGHTGFVTCFAVIGTNLYSGSFDGTVQVRIVSQVSLIGRYGISRQGKCCQQC